MHVHTVVYFVNDSSLVIIVMFFKHILILHSLKASWRSYSHDADNLTYIDGCCLVSVCELKEDSQFTVMWLYKNKGFSLFFLLHSALSSLILCCGVCIT